MTDQITENTYFNSTVTLAAVLDYYEAEWSSLIQRGLQIQKVLYDAGRIQHKRILTREEVRGK